MLAAMIIIYRACKQNQLQSKVKIIIYRKKNYIHYNNLIFNSFAGLITATYIKKANFATICFSKILNYI